ncbi:hypothetical protein GCM10009863_22280 [Streptomyces axinellae]|uniref:Uncharacterized protein n=1 Tax=Streptomyces axinellae TaxID=552788 RepID=A0ABN3Q0N6_9ACTN
MLGVLAVVPVVDGDPVSVRRQGDRRRASDTARGTRHERSTERAVPHVRPLSPLLNSPRVASPLMTGSRR